MPAAGAQLARGAGRDRSRAQSRRACGLRRAGGLRHGLADAHLSGAGRRGHQVLDEPAADERAGGCDQGARDAPRPHQCHRRTHPDRRGPRPAVGEEVARRGARPRTSRGDRGRRGGRVHRAGHPAQVGGRLRGCLSSRPRRLGGGAGGPPEPGLQERLREVRRQDPPARLVRRRQPLRRVRGGTPRGRSAPARDRGCLRAEGPLRRVPLALRLARLWPQSRAGPVQVASGKVRQVADPAAG